ncbi:hypothetical protein PC116_g2257 [Phytophthora cactorum]|nr:hypothetical protein PC111_g11348 [Phytophthora cactorum]KAG3057601.1 hypothetical protein PI125_g25370 [Phytophthora idaei]KAG2843132.1 hypothetical protein PC112_g2750 [Phytophthora cactorum]KAG2863275.1 hypothetical protein PC113_g5580 [Phytophthora cactorum]KAG2920978.1 hypothetical protein PC114_g5864 [Phytophthora cactorum]
MAKNPAAIVCGTMDLKLFLSKKNSAWLNGADAGL